MFRVINHGHKQHMTRWRFEQIVNRRRINKIGQKRRIRSIMKEILKGLDLQPYDVQMWDHYCLEEGCMMSVEKDHECNWCGEKEQPCK
jgi:hypothetical protein